MNILEDGRQAKLMRGILDVINGWYMKVGMPVVVGSGIDTVDDVVAAVDGS